MNFDLLRTYINIVELGSFNAAAEALHLTQPAISFQIKSLEKKLNTKLINRTKGKNLHLTTAGIMFYHFSKSILNQYNKFVEQIGNNSEPSEIIVGASRYIASYILPHILCLFNTNLSNIKIGMRILNSTAVYQNVIDKQLDLGIVNLLPVNVAKHNIIGKVTESILLVGTPNYLTKCETLQIILPNASIPLRQTYNYILFNSNLNNYNISLELDSMEAIKRAVLMESGVGFLFKRMIKTELDHNQLVEVPVFKDQPLTLTFGLVHSTETYKKPIINQLADFIMTSWELPQGSYPNHPPGG